MLAQQNTTVVDSSVQSILKLEVNDYRRLITQLQNEIVSLNSRIKGVKALTKMLHDSEEKRARLDEKVKHYEMALKRAEARIAQLNKMFGIGPQTAFSRGVVMPGVSRRDFDLLTEENIKLKKALEHIVPTNLGGPEIVLKNQELYDLVSTMQEDLSRSENHVRELESALRTQEGGGSAKVPELTRQVMKLERSLTAKQVFCESLIKENERLKRSREGASPVDKQEVERDSVDGKRPGTEASFQDPALLEKIKSLNQEVQVLQRDIEEKAKAFSESEKKLERMQAEKEGYARQISELDTVLKEKEQEFQRKINLEKEQLSKKCGDLQKKCDGFFKQVVSLNNKQQESEAELDRLKQALHHQADELEEKKALISLMTESLKSYEDDFRRENEEKAKCQKMLDKAQQDAERAKRENQSHMATIRHLEDEFERMNRLLNEERKRGNELKNNPGSFFALHNPALPAAGTRSLFPQGNRPMQVVADGVDESDGTRQPDPYSMPTTKEENSNAPSLIECPYCSCSFPYREIETHVQDCMENSLYMDDKD